MIRLLPGRVASAGRRLKRAGHAGGAKGLAAEALRTTMRVPARFAAFLSESIFDLRRGINTGGMLLNEAALTPLSAGGDPEPYSAVSLRQWRRMHSAIRINRSQYSLVDLGCGRGRPLVLAAEMGFGRVIGVELDQRLAAEAERNISRWRKRRALTSRGTPDVTVVQGDAVKYALPEGPLVLSLNNPFGPDSLRPVLAQVCDANRHGGAPTFIAYSNPRKEQVFAEFPGLVPLSRGKGWSVYRLDASEAGDRGQLT